MTSITLFEGFILPAEEGPYRVKIWPPEALEPTLKAYAYRSSAGWLDYAPNPEKAAKRIATIRKKLILHHARKKTDTRSAECKEGIRMGSQGRRG